jgi:hypothetical protein
MQKIEAYSGKLSWPPTDPMQVESLPIDTVSLTGLPSTEHGYMLLIKEAFVPKLWRCLTPTMALVTTLLKARLCLHK